MMENSSPFIKGMILMLVLSVGLTGCGDNSEEPSLKLEAEPNIAKIDPSEGGKVSHAELNMEEGGAKTFIATPNFGYLVGPVQVSEGFCEVESLSDDGSTAKEYSVSGDASGGCIISVVFELETHTATVVLVNGLATVIPSKLNMMPADTKSFQVSPDDGYYVTNISSSDNNCAVSHQSDGALVSSVTASVSNAIGSCDIIVTLDRLAVTIHLGLGGDSVIFYPSNTNPAFFNYAEDASFSIIPKNGFSISHVNAAESGGTLVGDEFIIEHLTKRVEAYVSFRSDIPPESKSFLQAIADGVADPVMINGESWTFRTPPPPVNERTVITGHPRLLLTPDNLPATITKLQDPVYRGYINSMTATADEANLSPNPNDGMLENAFLYQITKDASRATAAKEALLNFSGDYGEAIIFGYDRMADKLGPILVFDWIMETLTPAEKAEIFANVKSNFSYDHKTASPINRDGSGEAGVYPWYFNDVYNRHPELYLPALAFTVSGQNIGGDNVIDDWANEVIAWAYDEDESRVVGPYGANRGSGFLDAMASLSLDSGGLSPTGYYNYIIEVLHAASFWQSATGQPMWSRMPVLEKGPFTCLTRCENTIDLHSRKSSAFEYATGMYEGDSASMARHVIDTYGMPRYQVVYRAILGDLRVPAKMPVPPMVGQATPEGKIAIPLAGYLRGENTFYSRSSWDTDNTLLVVRSPYLDLARYPGNDGIFVVYKGDKKIATAAGISKTAPDAGVQSGIWIYDPNNLDPDPANYAANKPLQKKGTYWSNDRAHDAWTAVSQSKYFDGGPKATEVTDTYRAISMEYAQRYGIDITTQQPKVTTAQRTIIHIPEADRDYIVVYDYIDMATNLKSAWSMRLMEEPTIDGSLFSIAGTMNATVVSPAGHTLEWMGGFEKEFVTPSPEQAWYTNRKSDAIPGYSTNRTSAIDRLGYGNLYVQPAGQKDSSVAPYVPQTEYLVVLEINGGSSIPVSVEKVSDRMVRFGGWQVEFSQDGTIIPPVKL